jgi:type II secretory pathway pseudopilin PulG
MKKSFTLIEVIIAVSLLSVVLLSLFQVRSNNIFILEKTDEKIKDKQYLSMVYDTKGYSKRNENIYLDRYFNIKDDDLRRKLKEVKIKVKDEILDLNVIKTDIYNIRIQEFETSYSIENKITKNIYRFELSL